MDLKFDFDGVIDTEFLVAEGNRRRPDLDRVRVDESVRQMLIKAASDTWTDLQACDDGPELYDPSNDYGTAGFLYLPLDDLLAEKPRYLFQYGNARTLTAPLDTLPRIGLYCVRFSDDAGAVLLGVKKTGDFGQRLKKPGRVRLINAGLELVNEPEFQLANHLDFLVDLDNVFIYKHKSFETASHLQNAIIDSVAENVDHIGGQMSYVDFSSFCSGSTTGVKHARLLATIKAKNYCANLTPEKLKDYCQHYEVEYVEQNGVMRINESAEHKLTFLRILARQYLEIELKSGSKEHFLAPNRRSVP